MRAGRIGGSRVIGIASGTTPPAVLRAEDTDALLDDLTNTAVLLAAIDSLTAD